MGLKKFRVKINLQRVLHDALAEELIDIMKYCAEQLTDNDNVETLLEIAEQEGITDELKNELENDNA